MSTDKRQMFFSDRNKALLLYNIKREYEQRLGGINSSQSTRLEKSLAHYMREVYSGAEAGSPIAAINREVAAITRRDFDNYLAAPGPKRYAAPPPATEDRGRTPRSEASYAATEDRGRTPRSEAASYAAAEDRMMADTGNSLDRMQKERQGNMPAPPPMPDFRITNESEDGPSPMELYELAKRQREKEAAASLADMPARVALANSDNQTIRNEIVNPAASLGIMLPPPMRTSKQDTLIREESILQYKENELNLFVSSADRNWTMDSLVSMNRYNFTVNFDPANNNQNATITPSTHKKFKNIVRIELVKLIVPKEALDILLQRTNDTPTYATNVQTNVLSYPSVAVQISELDGNNYGTNDVLDRAFGVVHYDAQWSADPVGCHSISATATNTITTGYVSLIPKFLKCQKVYEPTPLATLQKLSIQVQRPNSADLLSPISDVVGIASLRLGSGVVGSIYVSGAAPSSYIFVRTSTYFSRFMWETGDRLRFAASSVVSGAEQSIANMLKYLNQEMGLLLVGIGYTSDDLANVADGPNTVGYGNVLILQNRYDDPATGSTAAYSWGNEGDINTALTTATYSGNTINLNHQVQAVFRIITRDLDAATKLRPDNTF